jgi:hypothetical protein
VSVIKLRINGWVCHVSHRGKITNAFKSLAQKPQGKRTVMRPMSRWEDNIKMYLREIGYQRLD